MKKETLLKILNSDIEFSDDELLEILRTQDMREPEPEDPKPAEDPQPEEPEDPAPQPVDYSNVIKDAIKSGFDDLSKILQADGIRSSRLPEDNDDDILAQIIAPKLKERSR